ncbi:hypothetical protein [Streptomyces similanensis]|uniref:Uncharacterized protein n=1 Tax=Streptomyces similanensis TaxID=1274988 RepID=A0ABP9LKN9_9ACTN
MVTAVIAPQKRAKSATSRRWGLREAAAHHLPGLTRAALRFARTDDPAFPGPAGKRGAELLQRVGDLKKWARNRPRAATCTTDLG